MHRLLTLLLVAGLSSSAAMGQDKKDFAKDDKKDFFPKKEQPKKKSIGDTPKPGEHGIPGEVEILFLNGSKIRVLVQTEKLEIVSIYGKLTVPIEDVVAIEFGLHYPEGAVEKIDGAIKNLGSSDFRVRESAAKTLVNFGPFAYPSVLRATKAKDTEVSARAKDIVQKLQTKHPKKDLRTSTDDRVVTPTQTLVGRILTPTMMTKGEYFGVMEHKLANMRSIRSVATSSGEMDLVVDASKYANLGQWLDTGYQVDTNGTIAISAKGMIDQWPQGPGQYMCGPSGNLRGGFPGGGVDMVPGAKVRLGPNSRFYGGVLIGKIGEDGEPFIIGDRYDLKSETEGKLYLQIGPSPWNCASSGNYDVKISRKND